MNYFNFVLFLLLAFTPSIKSDGIRYINATHVNIYPYKSISLNTSSILTYSFSIREDSPIGLLYPHDINVDARLNIFSIFADNEGYIPLCDRYDANLASQCFRGNKSFISNNNTVLFLVKNPFVDEISIEEGINEINITVSGSNPDVIKYEFFIYDYGNGRNRVRERKKEPASFVYYGEKKNLTINGNGTIRIVNLISFTYYQLVVSGLTKYNTFIYSVYNFKTLSEPFKIAPIFNFYFPPERLGTLIDFNQITRKIEGLEVRIKDLTADTENFKVIDGSSLIQGKIAILQEQDGILIFIRDFKPNHRYSIIGRFLPDGFFSNESIEIKTPNEIENQLTFERLSTPTENENIKLKLKVEENGIIQYYNFTIYDEELFPISYFSCVGDIECRIISLQKENKPYFLSGNVTNDVGTSIESFPFLIIPTSPNIITENSKKSRNRDIAIAVSLPLSCVLIIIIILYVYHEKNKYKPPKGIKDEIEISEINKIKKIGSGNFSIVFKVVYNEKEYAMKELKKKTKKNIKDLFREADIMRKLKGCDNVMDIIGVCSKSYENICIIMELADQGSLRTYLKYKKQSIEFLNLMALNIAEGIEYIHDRNILHCDIALRNCLYDSRKNKAVISDFGMSREVYMNSEFSSEEGTIMIPLRWAAPELLENFNFTYKTDIWALGVTLWELYSDGMEPYAELTDAQVQSNIPQGARLLNPKRCYPEVWRKIAWCFRDEMIRIEINSLIVILKNLVLQENII